MVKICGEEGATKRLEPAGPDKLAQLPRVELAELEICDPQYRRKTEQLENCRKREDYYSD